MSLSAVAASPCEGRHLGSRRRGAALLITLACITILSALIVAYLSHSVQEMQVSTISAGQTAASLFARGAVDSVIGELKQEITAGSISYPPTGSDVRDPATPFLPATNLTMVPYRMDPAAPVNVLKRSAYNRPFYSGVGYDASWPAPSWAANLSTTNRGTFGHAISLARWNRPLLMPTLHPSSTTDLTPTNTFIPPDWIYMTRAAAPATVWSKSLIPGTASESLNTSAVVGRYAYVVYDEGGLLDVNAAGYPSSVAAAAVRHKISEACADLTQIGLQSADIDALVSWRNPVSAASGSSYTNYLYTGATNAFLTPAPGERLFTSRQQLITFLTQNVANNKAAAVERMQQALPYLTHFSRELNAPSWYPTTNFTTAAYLNNATNSTSTATNLFVPLARAGTSYTDGSTLVVPAKQAAAFSRFPLSRLAWLGASGPVGATVAQIQQSFGLVWDGAYSAWKYVGPTGTTVQTSVAPLVQITGREPNFFELFKAGILTGAVGMEPSPDKLQLAGLGGGNLSLDTRFDNPDQHLMQIGLSIIDQASSALLPTRIEFGASVGTSALYGSKSLPYLYRFIFSPYRPVADSTMFNAWLEPVFWNPYQVATTNSGTLKVRVRLAAGNIRAATMAYTNNVILTEAIATPAPAVGAAGTGASIEIDANNVAAMASATTNPITLADLRNNSAVTITPSDANDITTPPEGSFTYGGFWLGKISAPNPPSLGAPTNSAGATTSYIGAAVLFGSSAAKTTTTQFIIEADAGSGFQEVQRMNFAYSSGASQTEFDGFTILGRRLAYYTFNDPRTGRFGFNLMNPPNLRALGTAGSTNLTMVDAASASWTSFFTPANSFSNNIHCNQTNRINSGAVSFTPNPASVGTGADYYDTFRYADNTSKTSVSNAPSYQDGDGVQRPGDGWWGSTAANTLPMRGDAPQNRPVLLNRSFYSVGELGYAFRDMPWRSLDFCTPLSADAGLLDFFSVNDGYAGATNAPVVGGRINLNTPHPEVLAAMLSGAARAQLYPANDISPADAAKMASAITNLTTKLPFLNKAELATRAAPADPTVVTNAVAQADIDTNIKERREALVRALASAGQVRTWNLLIDVVAQTGHFSPAATGFGDFLAAAEQHYWAHVALDRYTGQVISIQLEPVSE